MKARFVLTLLLAVLCSVFPSVLAQSAATISGVVTDPSGAAVSGAEISSQSLDHRKAAPARVVTDSSGRYTLSQSPGRYLLRITASGSFAQMEREITLASGDALDWSPRLQLERLSATVVVTAHAEPLEAQNSSASVSIISREQIEQRQTLWLAPLLSSLPGFSLSRLGRDGGVTSLFLNGGNSNFTKVLVDGTPVNEPGGGADFSNFALDNVEKIEVVRGAESALFGSDAMTGVVQIFSHRGTTRRPALTLLAEGGKFSTARGAAQLSGLLGRFDYSAAASTFYTSGQERNDHFRNTSLAGNLGWRFSDTHHLRFTARSTTSDAGVPGQTLFAPPDLDQHNGLRNFSSNLSWDFSTGLHWKHHLAGTEAYIRQFFDNPSSQYCFPFPSFICDSPFTSRNHFNRAGFQAQSSYRFRRGGVTAGYQYEAENGALRTDSPFGVDFVHPARNNQAGFLDARLQFGQRLTLNAGLRAEANASFGTRVVPRAGFAYALRFGHGFWGSTRARLSYGLGIKEPNMIQSFSLNPFFLGNPDLRPERSRTMSVGVEQMVASDRLRITAEYFANRFRDIVSFGSGTFFNTDLARARGANLQLEARPQRWLSITGNYSFVDSRVLDSPKASDPSLIKGNRLFKRPVHSGNLIFNANFWRINWNLAGYFIGGRTDSDFLSNRFVSPCLGPCLSSNPGYAKVDLAANYDFGRGVTAFGRVENLFDKNYQESLGYSAYRRAYRLGMRFRLAGK